jgi:hypothetical protein
MKSVIIRDSSGIVILKIKRTKDGVESWSLPSLGELEIKVMLHDRTFIRLKIGGLK